MRTTCDFHIHSFFSPCAEPAMSLLRIVDQARFRGMTDIGITDHPYQAGLARHHAALARARDGLEGPPRVWIGAELEVAGMERLVIPPNELPDADFILASPSHYDLANAPPVSNLDDPMEWADRMMTDMENVPGCGAHAIAHPFFVYGLHMGRAAGIEGLPFIMDVMAEIRPKRMDWLLERLASERVALEISPRMTYVPAFQAYMENLYGRARRAGVRFFLGSDSHRPGSVGDLGEAAGVVARLGLGEGDLWHPARAGAS